MLVTLIAMMALLAIGQIFLRNFFHSGMVWAEPMMRSLVLWVGMIGALVATRDNRHIRIDVLSRYLSVPTRRWLSVFTYIFSSLVCAILAWHSARFVLIESEQTTLAFAFVPTWLVATVIPFAFAVMTLRFALYALRDLRGVQK